MLDMENIFTAQLYDTSNPKYNRHFKHKIWGQLNYKNVTKKLDTKFTDMSNRKYKGNSNVKI